MEWIESLWADFRYALRSFRRTPAFTAVATITLALGIGATTAMFTLVDSILLRPLPYPESDRLVRVIQSYPELGLDTWGLNQQNIALYRDRSTDFVAFAGYQSGSVTLQSTDGPQRIPISRVTSGFFRTIGIGPTLGRPFTAQEDTPGQTSVMILSYEMWQTRFGADRSVLGRVIQVDDKPVRIIGVMPQGFGFPRPDIAAWMPLGLDPMRRFGFVNSGLARLRPGVSIEHAERQTTAIMWDWARQNQNPKVDPSKTRMKTIVRPLQEVMTASSARPLVILFAAVSLILLIAAANVATLLSGRAAARSREITLRAALGASRGRVLRQLLTESIALALLGAVTGVTLAIVAVRAFTHSTLATLPRMNEVAVDGRVLAFTLLVSLLTGLVFGVLPALHAGRARLTSALVAGQRESSNRSSRRINNSLVVAQLALSVVLTIAAGLVVKSFQRLAQIDLGFRPENVTAIALPLPQRIANDAGAIDAFMSTTLERVRAIPGIQAAALASTLPIEGQGDYDALIVEGREAQAGVEGQTHITAVSPGYFKTVGIPLLFGRDIASTDDSASVNVAVVDQALAQRFWRGADALGKRIHTGGDTTWRTIVGVVGSVRDDDVALAPAPHVYTSVPQVGANRLSLAVRTSGAPAPVIADVRHAVAQIDASIPLDDVRSFSSILDQSFAPRRLTKLLLGGFALIGLLLAAVGIYGVMSLHVANRSREFGIRLAIGADPRAVVRLVLGEGAVLAASGVALGLGGAMVLTRWIASLLYDVSPTDPAILVSLPVILGAVALAACYIPARRAAKSDPLATLRAD